MSLINCLARIRQDIQTVTILGGWGTTQTSEQLSTVHTDDVRVLIDVAEAAWQYVAALAEVTRVYDAGEMTVGDAQEICESKTDALIAAVGGAADATG